MKKESWPAALTIAGSDSGGGAGAQTDLKTFAALGVHGASALTCLTAQNPKRVLSIHAAPARFVREQIEAVFEELPPKAIKTGMLYSREIIAAVADALKGGKPPLVVDPVMISTSGARLLKPAALGALQDRLFPLASLVTPNLDEASALAEMTIETVEDCRAAARLLQSRYGCAFLVKGGHLKGGVEAVDIFQDGREECLLAAPFVRGVSTHGTGCLYSAAITGYLALGAKLGLAVQLGKNFVTQSIAHSIRVGRHDVLNPFW